ncbi:hypothetical protein F5Y14DRAFT_126664 [Nemania sp. NC0429]|nr:hypothetical protein F5Y14DRAFT_126664 [Nemania sp. NC0429]
MAALRIPGAGLQLESAPGAGGSLPMQAFGIMLNDSMIEDMIKSVQGGQQVELTLGTTPTFHYGSREEPVSVVPESFGYELYVTDLTNSANKTQRLPQPTMSILKKPPASLGAKKVTKVTAKHASRASSSGVDSDADARAGRYAQKSDKGPKPVNGGPKGVKLLATGKSAIASVFASTTTRSLPSSPALNGVASPNPGFSASQQVLEKNKGQRSALVHELAVRDQPLQRLKDVWTGTDSDLTQTVEKVADFDKSTEKWSLKKRYWKELDVWNYDYSGPDDRKSAIDNAIKVYDKQRVVLSDPVWDRLLPKEDRNKNIVLSKLQATIAKQGTNIPAPKLSVQKAEEGNKSDMDSSKAKGEAMSRSNSQPTTSKPKKISEREAQTKRLLSNNTKKPAPKKPAAKAKASEEKGKKILSEEFVYDSDTSEEAIPPSQNTNAASNPKPPQKQAEKPAEKPAKKPISRVSEKPKEPPPPSAAVKPKPKPLVRAPRAPIKALGAANKSPQKRPREDEDGSSSSGAPLSKRTKSKETPKPPAEPKATKHRTSDASQNSRGTNGTVSSSFTMKSKNTSPTKSSPLVTSPPTNASDIDERPSSQRPRVPSHQPSQQQQRNVARDRERGRDPSPAPGATKNISSTAVTSKKRKEREPVDESPDTTPTPPTKKSRLSEDIIEQAHAFTEYYKTYKTLHSEMVSLKDPPEDKLNKLITMHDRLKNMKRQIQRAVASAAAKSGS